MWDAVSMLAGAKESRAAIALSPLLPLLVHRALGRGVPQPVRVAAMHALAACAGAEETSSDADMLRALLPPEVRWPAVLRDAMHAVHDRGLALRACVLQLVLECIHVNTGEERCAVVLGDCL